MENLIIKNLDLEGDKEISISSYEIKIQKLSDGQEFMININGTNLIGSVSVKDKKEKQVRSIVKWNGQSIGVIYIPFNTIVKGITIV